MKIFAIISICVLALLMPTKASNRQTFMMTSGGLYVISSFIQLENVAHDFSVTDNVENKVVEWEKAFDARLAVYSDIFYHTASSLKCIPEAANKIVGQAKKIYLWSENMFYSAKTYFETMIQNT